MPRVDLVVRQARIVDGTGGPARAGDVAIDGDRIVRTAARLDCDGREEIDAGGLVLAPGFIDAHTHDDRAALADSAMGCKVSQGVTTVVVGNCGISLAPVVLDARPPPPLDLISSQASGFFATFADYFRAVSTARPAVNVVAQCGHSSLRVMAMDRLDRPATLSEVEAMRAALRQAMEDGAAGLSTGLAYPPAIHATTEEVEALAEVVASYRGFHSTHMRNEGEHVMPALAETFRIGRHARLPVIISHHKCAGLGNHGRSHDTLALISEARRTQPVALDAYPYVASSTVLARSMIARARRVIVTWSAARPEVAGRDLADIAREMGLSDEEAVDRLLPAGAVYFVMDEEDVRRILAYPATMIGSDGLPHDSHPHPRLWGTFPRVLGHYARDVGLFPLETAVHKMTGLTAAAFGLKDRGHVGEGCYADLVLFDPAAVRDAATFDKPATPAEGIAAVIVNGRITWREGRATGERAGRALRRQDLAPLAYRASEVGH